MQGMPQLPSSRARLPCVAGTLGALLVGVLPGGATRAGEQAAGNHALETVVVTATKRREDLLDVPASLWVATSEDLERGLARDFDDLVRLVPSLTVTKTSQPANNSINLRGIGTYAFSIATKPSVAVVVDDIPQAFQAQAFAPLADVGQIEVLRGPQSTLFGTSATAGVIHIVTRAPGHDFGMDARMFVTDDGEQRASASVSGPLNERLRARLFVGAAGYRGNLRNLHTGNWINGHDDLTAQFRLVWEPAMDWQVSVASRWNDTKGTCCTHAMEELSPGVSFGRFQGYSADQAAVLEGIRPAPGNRDMRADIEPRGEANDRGASLRVEKFLKSGTLAWISGVGGYALQDMQDTDGSAFNWGPGGADIPGAAVGGSANGGHFIIDAISSELRLASAAERRLRYLAGLHVAQTESSRFFVRGSNDLTRYGSLGTVPSTASPFTSYDARSRSRNLALFGTAAYDLSPQFELVAGLRLNREALRYSLHDQVNDVRFGDPACSTSTPSGLVISTCDQYSSVTGKLSLTWRPDARLMLFGGYDRGYKGAAYDLTSTYASRGPVTAPGPHQGYPIGDAVAAKQPIAAETVDAFQLGIRATLDDSWRLSLTAFHADFQDFQAQSRDEITRQNILNSVGRVRTRGIELDLLASPVRGMSLGLAGAYNDAVARRFPNASCYASQTAALGCVNGEQDLSGQRMSNAPRWTLAASTGLEWRTSGSRLFLDASLHWQSKVWYSLLRDPRSLQGAYGIVNLSAGIERGGWRARAFVVNALDKSYALTRARDGSWNINPYGSSAGPVTDAVRWAPGRDSRRYVGLDVSASLTRLTGR